MAANSGEAQSAPSAVYEYRQLNCEVYAEIKFETVTFTDVDDHEPGSCDTAEVYYTLIAYPAESKQFWSMDNTFDMDCGTYIFDRMAVGSPQASIGDNYDTLIAPIDPANPSVTIWPFLSDEDDIFGGVNDHLCSVATVIRMPYQNWANYSKKYSLRCGEGVTSSSGFDAEGYIEFTVKGFKAPPGGP